MHFLLFILIGLIAGALAGRVVSGHGYRVAGDIVVGVVGAFLGGWIFATFLGVGGGGFFISLFIDRKSTRLNSSHIQKSRMPSSA